MTFNQIWEKTHKAQEWGKYPSEDLVRWVFKHFGGDRDSHKTKHILDLGCGQGNNTWFLAREGFNVFAVDGSGSAIRKTSKRLVDEACTLRVVVVPYDFTSLPNKSESFDAVIDVVSSCHNSIHHLPDIYREVHRVLKPGGRFFMMCPTSESSQEPFKDYGAVSFIDKTDLQLLLQSWFDIVELTKSSYQPTSKCKVEHWVVSATKK
jgi:SAM-dependent methyltransferase